MAVGLWPGQIRDASRQVFSSVGKGFPGGDGLLARWVRCDSPIGPAPRGVGLALTLRLGGIVPALGIQGTRDD